MSNKATIHTVQFVLLLALFLTLSAVAPSAAFSPPAPAYPGNGTTPTSQLRTSGGAIGKAFPITTLAIDQVSPSVAYNAQRQEYLVVWYNDRPGNDDIQAQRVAKGGKLLGQPFYISAGPGVDRRYPDVAYDSQQHQYLVVWEQQDGDRHSIIGRLVAGAGGVLGGEFIIAAASSQTFSRTDHSLPAVAYAFTSNRYLVVWQAIWSSSVPPMAGSDIAGQVVSTTGSMVGSMFTISAGMAPCSRPDVAYNRARNEYLVVWQQIDASAIDSDVFGRRVTGNGQPLQPDSIEISGTNWSGDQGFPSVAALPTVGSDGQFLVAWRDTNPGNLGHIIARRIHGAGSPDGSSFFVGSLVSLFTKNQTAPAVAGNERAKEYLVAWIQPATSPSPFVQIFARGVSPAGSVLGDETLLGGSQAARSAVVGGWLGDFMVAFDDAYAVTNNREVFGHLWGNRLALPRVLRHAR